MQRGRFGAVALACVLCACSSSSSSPAIPHCCDGSTATPDASHAVDSGASAHDATVSHDAAASRDAAVAHDAGGSHDAAVAQPDATTPVADADADACTVCGRDWTKYPAIADVSGATELWVVSDIHGDYGACTKLLAAGHVIASVPSTPSAVQWGAGSATFVVVGDMIDKGPDAPDVVTLLSALQVSAAAAGGRVIVTMGNHEAEFLADPENSKATGADGLDPQLAALGLSPDATAAGSDAIGAFIKNLPFAARVDDWFFVHAGDTNGATFSALQTSLQSGVDSMGFGAPVLADAGSLLEARLNSSSPQWWDATGNATTLLTSWTSALGVKHLVMGHQPGAVGITNGPNRAKDQMAAEYGGLLFLIDTGLSVDVDDTGGALLHVTNVGTSTEAWAQVLPDGSTKSL